MKKSTPPPRPDFGPWEISIEPLDPHGWHVSLKRGAMRYGPQGWGWIRLTLAGARRKGARELRRRQKRDQRLFQRAQLEEATRS